MNAPIPYVDWNNNPAVDCHTKHNSKGVPEMTSCRLKISDGEWLHRLTAVFDPGVKEVEAVWRTKSGNPEEQHQLDVAVCKIWQAFERWKSKKE